MKAQWAIYLNSVHACAKVTVDMLAVLVCWFAAL